MESAAVGAHRLTRAHATAEWEARSLPLPHPTPPTPHAATAARRRRLMTAADGGDAATASHCASALAADSTTAHADGAWALDTLARLGSAQGGNAAADADRRAALRVLAAAVLAPQPHSSDTVLYAITRAVVAGPAGDGCWALEALARGWPADAAAAAVAALDRVLADGGDGSSDAFEGEAAGEKLGGGFRFRSPCACVTASDPLLSLSLRPGRGHRVRGRYRGRARGGDGHRVWLCRRSVRARRARG